MALLPHRLTRRSPTLAAPSAHRRRLIAAVLGLGLACSCPAATAAQNIVLVSGAFRRSIPVADMELLAKQGEAQGLLADILRFSGQKPAEVGKLLNQSFPVPLVLASRLLSTRIGEALLERLARIVYPLKTPGVGMPALRSAIVLGIADNNGSLSPISFLNAYPNSELEVNLPALVSLLNKASSISDLVRFFSESPLDGLRGSGS
ncbi:MAG: alpha/beta hydrolase [Cyanobium sp.]